MSFCLFVEHPWGNPKRRDPRHPKLSSPYLFDAVRRDRWVPGPRIGRKRAVVDSNERKAFCSQGMSRFKAAGHDAYPRTCVALPTKKNVSTKSLDEETLERPLPPIFFLVRYSVILP